MPKKILVSTDFSPSADRILAVAIDMAERTDACVEIIHVRSPGRTAFAFPLDVTDQGATARELHHAEQALARRAHRVQAAGVTVTTRLLVGSPGETNPFGPRPRAAELVVLGAAESAA
ncbi:MAG TPA: universal stress protein [Polyangia bacterium]|jgi:nucleotide-binding universal stress UspA family protein